MKCTKDEELDNAIFKCFIQKRSEGVPISRIMIQQKAPIFNSKLGGSIGYQASSAWLESSRIVPEFASCASREKHGRLILKHEASLL
ncbi:hypothetical protein AVEN_60085-1 [Araneus ventricosus]|uniref:HTH CENPB-type domain-containing protein n=1 Tax=Araneus ventricosus TaxID=182803 RepID=A0A4Y2HZY1_ARAVE|nr:hypothetical protein AVEN_60085-1 [Araneus ventricosus]